MKKNIRTLVTLFTAASLLTTSLPASGSNLLCPVRTAKAETAPVLTDTGLNYKESTDYVKSHDCGYPSVRGLNPARGKDWSADISEYSIRFIKIAPYSGGLNGEGVDYDLDETFFQSLKNTLQSARNHHTTLGLRFRYDDSGITDKSNNGVDPMPKTFEKLLDHIHQIGESGLLTEYQDVIGFVETGMVGCFGEQWGTNYCSIPDKAKVLDAFLKITPEDMPVLVRTPNIFREWLHEYANVPLESKDKSQEVLTASNMSHYEDFIPATVKTEQPELLTKAKRVGLYNDGYMGSGNDLGTYGDRAGETEWLSGTYAYGGEFSGSHGFRIEQKTWLPETAIPEMYKTHLYRINGNIYKTYTVTDKNIAADQVAEKKSSILSSYEKGGLSDYDIQWSQATNTDGTVNVSYRWIGYDDFTFTRELDDTLKQTLGQTADNSAYYGSNCFDYIKNHLGYRYVIKKCEMTKELDPGAPFRLSFAVDNTGFSPAVRNKELELILSKDDQTYSIRTVIDPNQWAAGMRSEETISLDLPSSMAAGDWQVGLRLSDKNTDPDFDTAFSTRFANQGIVYDESTGINQIGTLKIKGEVIEKEVLPDARPAGYYPKEQALTLTENTALSLLDQNYTFREDGHYGYNFYYKIEGIQTDSTITLGQLSNTFQTKIDGNVTGYGSTGSGHGLNGMSIPLEQDGTYCLHLPFLGCAWNADFTSTAGETLLTSLLVSNPNVTWANNNPSVPDTYTVLNGNEIKITPIAFTEGWASNYEVTFHTADGDQVVSGDQIAEEKNRLKDVSSTVPKNTSAIPAVQCVASEWQPRASYTNDFGTYRFVGWSTRKDDATTLISNAFPALPGLELWPYYELDTSKTDLTTTKMLLTNHKDAQGIYYTLDDATGTATVGDGSNWSQNAGSVSGDVIIPAQVTENGHTYYVTAIGANAFADNTDLTSVIIPVTVQSIGENAFANTSDELKMTANENSAAADYAKALGIETTLLATVTIPPAAIPSTTAKATATTTATATAKPTASASAKPAVSPSATASAKPTATATATADTTPTATAKPTASASVKPATPTVTPTASTKPTVTASAKPTATSKATVSPTATAKPTVTASTKPTPAPTTGNTSVLTDFTLTGQIKGISSMAIGQKVILAPGTTMQLTLLPVPETAIPTEITYTCEDQRIAYISTTGNLRTLQGGTTTITVTAGSLTKQFQLQVVKHKVKAIQLKSHGKLLKKRKLTLKRKKSIRLSVRFKGKHICKKIYWSSSRPKVASVNQKGKITAHKKGVVKITARAMDGSGKKKVLKIRIK